MTGHVLVLGLDESDCLDAVIASPTMTRYRDSGAHIALVWPGAFQRIVESDPFDRLFVTVRVRGHDQAKREAWVAACLTRVRGKDGRTPAQRIREAS